MGRDGMCRERMQGRRSTHTSQPEAARGCTSNDRRYEPRKRIRASRYLRHRTDGHGLVSWPFLLFEKNHNQRYNFVFII